MKSTVVFLLCAVTAQVYSSRTDMTDTLDSGDITGWGKWRSYVECPENTYAIGFRQRVEPWKDKNDDTAMNSVELECARMPGYQDDHIISSHSGFWGSWQPWQRCSNNQYLVGFNLKVEPDQGSGDDTSANSISMRCSDGNELIGNGGEFGSQTGWAVCKDNEAICSLQLRIEDEQSNFLFINRDDTALNQVRMGCCKFPKSKETADCTPSDDYKVIAECDNEDGVAAVECTYKKVIGLTKSTGKHSERSKGTETSVNVGTTVSSGIPEVLQASFSANVGLSQTTGYNWGTSDSRVFSSTQEIDAKLTVPSGKSGRILQVVGICGDFNLYTTKLKFVGKQRYNLKSAQGTEKKDEFIISE